MVRISYFDKIIVVCLFFAASVSLLSDSLNKIALYAALPCAFMLSFLKCRKVSPNYYVTLLFLLFAWDFLSSIWAVYPDSASRELHRVLGSILLVYIIGVNAYKKNLIRYIYIAFIILYIGAWIYASQKSLITSDIVGEQDRLNDNKLNANTMAYYTYYSTFALYVLSNLTKSDFWRKVYNYLFIAMVPLSFYVALVTASRQVLIIQVPLMAFLLIERYYMRANHTKRVLFIALCFIAILLVTPYVIEIFNNSFLATRSQKVIEEDARWFLLMDAINIGIQHFPFGVGAGNYIDYSYSAHFSHCSYTELFANNGIVGLLLYVVLLIKFVKIQWKRFTSTKDRQFIIFLVFGLIFIFDQVFYVFYTDLWLISFFVLVATHSDKYYQENIEKLKQQ